ncbi:hypothetical protein C8J57DRAFT_1339140 [Mycena rebaudengoi]|nr:hypothetical protein C8J57DRAFT_1339140 [Mycena rebaudengoi]
MGTFRFPYTSDIYWTGPIWQERTATLARAPGQRFSRYCVKFPLQTVELSEPLHQGYSWDLLAEIFSDTALQRLIHYTMRGILAKPEVAQEPLFLDVSPFLNPFFIPMQSTSEKTQEIIWSRVLYFGLYPSRLSILLVSKAFNVPGSGLISHQIISRPDLGSHIRFIYLPSYSRISDKHQLTLLSHAPNIEKGMVLGHSIPQNLSVAYLPGHITAQAFEMFCANAGATLREFIVGIAPTLSQSLSASGYCMSTSVLTHFTELRHLYFCASESIVNFTLGHTPIPGLADALSKLRTLHIQYSSSAFYSADYDETRTLPNACTCGTGDSAKFLTTVETFEYAEISSPSICAKSKMTCMLSVVKRHINQWPKLS